MRVGSMKVNMLLKSHLESGIPKTFISILSDTIQALLSEYLFVPGTVLICDIHYLI